MNKTITTCGILLLAGMMAFVALMVYLGEPPLRVLRGLGLVLTILVVAGGIPFVYFIGLARSKGT